MILRVVGVLPSSSTDDEKNCNARRVTFVSVNREKMTVGQVAEKALAAFVAAESAADSRTPAVAAETAAAVFSFREVKPPLRLVIECGRERVIDAINGLREERGELSQMLEENWEIAPYLDQRSSPPWSVCAFLVFRPPGEEKFFVPAVNSAPPLPDGREIASRGGGSGAIPARIEAEKADLKPVSMIG